MYVKELQELRKRIANTCGQNTYLVFNDADMQLLLINKPKTLDELSKIKGFPKTGKRFNTYGKEIVQIFNKKQDSLGATSIFG